MQLTRRDFLKLCGGTAGGAAFLGMFIVAIHGAGKLATKFEEDRDDYDAIIVKAIADRLAEACAEWLHHKARIEWGYEEDEE